MIPEPSLHAKWITGTGTTVLDEIVPGLHLAVSGKGVDPAEVTATVVAGVTVKGTGNLSGRL